MSEQVDGEIDAMRDRLERELEEARATVEDCRAAHRKTLKANSEWRVHASKLEAAAEEARQELKDADSIENSLRYRIGELEAALRKLMDPLYPQSVIEVARAALQPTTEEGTP